MLDTRLSPQGRTALEKFVESREGEAGVGGLGAMGVGGVMLERPSGVWRDRGSGNLVRWVAFLSLLVG